MDVSEAVDRRMSVRAFLPDAVDTQAIRDVLVRAARAPSGGNLQPWRIVIVNGEAMTRFRAIMDERMAGKPIEGGEQAEYSVYPSPLQEPYRTRRFAVGEEMYALLGIERENRPGRLQWFANNYRFFGAPAAIFCFVERNMGAPQWSDLGMFLQTAMLLFQERGLDTCAQECWAVWPKTVAQFCGMGPEWMLFCGMAIGRRDPDHPVNALRTTRADPGEWLSEAGNG
jgi:nitroreductase